MMLWAILGGGFLFVAGYILGLALERRQWQDLAKRWAERIEEEYRQRAELGWLDETITMQN